MNNIRYREDPFNFKNVIKEYFEDKDSFLVNDIFLNSLNEAESLKLTNEISTDALKSTRRNLEKLNKKGVYGDIPKTKGDFSKSEYYKPTKQCLNLLESILQNAKGFNVQETRKCFEGCKFALENLERNKDYFKDGYTALDSNVILLYQNICMALVLVTSILSINSLSITNIDQFKIVYKDCKKGTYDKSLTVKNIYKFNDICRNKKLPQIKKFNETIESIEDMEFSNLLEENSAEKFAAFKNSAGRIKDIAIGPNKLNNLADFFANGKETKTGHKVAAGIALAGVTLSLVALVIYMSRNLIMMFFALKNTAAQFATYTADMVYANSLTLEHDPTKKGKVSEKQKNISNKLSKLGEVLDSDFKQAEHKASVKISEEDKKTTTNLERKLDPDKNDGEGNYDSDTLFI